MTLGIQLLDAGNDLLQINFSHQGKTEDAIREFTKALQGNPQMAEAYCGLGFAYRYRRPFSFFYP